ncbi:MAG: DUF2798 domain-containing protein [Chloroflexota bacterium]
MKISKGMYGFIQGVLIGLVMSFAISFVLMAFNIGFTNLFIMIWLQSALMGFVVSIPVGTITFPIVERIMKKFFLVTS